MLRSFSISLLLVLTYLLGGLAPTLWLTETRARAADAPPLPYHHAAAWHAQYQAQFDCWDRCNGDQGRAAFLAARVKPRPAAPAPRFAAIDVHLPVAPAALAEGNAEFPAPPARYASWPPAPPCTICLGRTVPPPERKPCT